jgi:hypothetical protein
MAVALSAETLSFNWNYLTFDCCGSQWDPVGYVVNGVQTQLSTDSGTQGLGSTGSFVLTLNAGGLGMHARVGCPYLPRDQHHRLS